MQRNRRFEKRMLTKKQLTHIEKRLMEERARAQKALGMFDEMAKADRESGDSALSAYTDHMADQGTEAMERERQPFSLRRKAGTSIASRRPCVGSITTPSPSERATPAGPPWASSGSTLSLMPATASTAR